MEEIEIKRINDELYLKLNDLVDFQRIYDSLEEKLNIIKEQNFNNKLKLNILLGYRNITSQDLFCLCELILKDTVGFLKHYRFRIFLIRTRTFQRKCPDTPVRLVG